MGQHHIRVLQAGLPGASEPTWNLLSLSPLAPNAHHRLDEGRQRRPAVRPSPSQESQSGHRERSPRTDIFALDQGQEQDN